MSADLGLQFGPADTLPAEIHYDVVASHGKDGHDLRETTAKVVYRLNRPHELPVRWKVPRDGSTISRFSKEVDKALELIRDRDVESAKGYLPGIINYDLRSLFYAAGSLAMDYCYGDVDENPQLCEFHRVSEETSYYMTGALVVVPPEHESFKIFWMLRYLHRLGGGSKVYYMGSRPMTETDNATVATRYSWLGLTLNYLLNDVAKQNLVEEHMFMFYCGMQQRCTLYAHSQEGGYVRSLFRGYGCLPARGLINEDPTVGFTPARWLPERPGSLGEFKNKVITLFLIGSASVCDADPLAPESKATILERYEGISDDVTNWRASSFDGMEQVPYLIRTSVGRAITSAISFVPKQHPSAEFLFNDSKFVFNSEVDAHLSSRSILPYHYVDPLACSHTAGAVAAGPKYGTIRQVPLVPGEVRKDAALISQSGSIVSGTVGVCLKNAQLRSCGLYYLLNPNQHQPKENEAGLVRLVGGLHEISYCHEGEPITFESIGWRRYDCRIPAPGECMVEGPHGAVFACHSAKPSKVRWNGDTHVELSVMTPRVLPLGSSRRRHSPGYLGSIIRRDPKRRVSEYARRALRLADGRPEVVTSAETVLALFGTTSAEQCSLATMATGRPAEELEGAVVEEESVGVSEDQQDNATVGNAEADEMENQLSEQAEAVAEFRARDAAAAASPPPAPDISGFARSAGISLTLGGDEEKVDEIDEPLADANPGVGVTRIASSAHPPSEMGERSEI